MVTLLHSCVKVCEAIRQSSCHLGCWWGRPRDGCIRWGPHPKGKGRFWGFFPIGLNDIFGCVFKTQIYLTRAWKLYNIFIWQIYHWKCHLFFFLRMYSVTRSKLAFWRNLHKCNDDLDFWLCKQQASQQQTMVRYWFCWLLMYKPKLLAKKLACT